LSPGRLDRVRASLKPRPRRPAPGPAPAATPQAPVPVVNAATASDLEARRARLAREYAEVESDLGGLVYEMAIRDSYRLDVITRRAAKLQAVDAQLTEVEQAIAALAQPATPVAPAVGVPPPTPAAPAPAATAPSAAAAAPVPPSASQAPTAVVPPVGPVSAAAAYPQPATCPSCARPIEPGAAFCGACGSALGSAPPPSGAPAR
jgi:hypothetical protein